MEALRTIYKKIPNKWKIWILTFLIAWIIRWLFGIEVLLTILIFTIAICILLRSLGVKGTLVIGKQAVGKLFGYFRGVIIFAFIPVVWELVRALFSNPSLDYFLQLAIVVIVMIIIWRRFDDLIAQFIKQNFGTHHRSRRRR